MIIVIDEPGQTNGQCPFEMSSKPTCEEGQQRPPMGKSRGSAASKLHRETIEPENATLVEDTTHNTPVQESGNPHGQGQDSETPSMAQQISTQNIGSDREDLTTDNIDRGTTEEVQGRVCLCEI